MLQSFFVKIRTSKVPVKSRTGRPTPKP